MASQKNHLRVINKGSLWCRTRDLTEQPGLEKDEGLRATGNPGGLALPWPWLLSRPVLNCSLSPKTRFSAPLFTWHNGGICNGPVYTFSHLPPDGLHLYSFALLLYCCVTHYSKMWWLQATNIYGLVVFVEAGVQVWLSWLLHFIFLLSLSSFKLYLQP